MKYRVHYHCLSAAIDLGEIEADSQEQAKAIAASRLCPQEADTSEQDSVRQYMAVDCAAEDA